MIQKLVLFIISLALSLAISTSAKSANAEEEDYAPDFTINRFDGSEFKLSDYRGKKSVYLVFWTTWCTYCIKKIPKLQYTTSVLNEQIEIIAINTSVKDTFANALKYQKERELKYPLAFDFGKKITDLYDVWGTPTEFIIDINGKIIHRDGIPDVLSEHLSNWNMIDHSKQTETLITKNECNKESIRC